MRGNPNQTSELTKLRKFSSNPDNEEAGKTKDAIYENTEPDQIKQEEGRAEAMEHVGEAVQNISLPKGLQTQAPNILPATFGLEN